MTCQIVYVSETSVQLKGIAFDSLRNSTAGNASKIIDSRMESANILKKR
jgi:hypothetical protein